LCLYNILGGRRKTALKLDDITLVTRFIINFAEEHALVLPGRVPGFKRDDIRILPSSENKSSIWRKYKAAMKPGDRVVGCSTFRKLWKQLLPFIVVAKPRADVCWECQKNNNFILRLVYIFNLL
jgi:hypothetical protein